MLFYSIRPFRLTFLGLLCWQALTGAAAEPETLKPLREGEVLDSLEKMWAGFDPRKEPLEVETLLEWEQEGVVLRVVRFRVGVFKGKVAKLAGIYGFLKGARSIPGLLQIHGGGQYADYKACLSNAKRGYATLSIGWAGRLSAPDYLVNPDGVKLFWEGETDDPKYKLTTDWGALDGYHAPSRNAGNAFPSVAPAPWTLDSVESPRNSGWYLSALAARRGLTFLELQPEVDPHRLGVYGHSMGGKLTVLTAVDSRVKAAAPSCGGISDRSNRSEIFRRTLGDDVSLEQVRCPIIFLSPANDFHGRISDLPDATNEIQSKQWRVTCSPHHNHQDTAPYEVATQLWFDQHLRAAFQMPETPQLQLSLQEPGGIPSVAVKPDMGNEILSVDVYYTQQGKEPETDSDRDNTVHRFWRHAAAEQAGEQWKAKLPVSSTDQPLWVYANVRYALEKPVSGAGYYYRLYDTESFNLSSTLVKVSSEELMASGINASLETTPLIESFEDGWEKGWFSYRPEDWGRSTNKLYDPVYQAPEGARLSLDVLAEKPNSLVIQLDGHAAEVSLDGGDVWQRVELSPHQFRDFASEGLQNWKEIKQLALGATARLRSTQPGKNESRVIGGNWRGAEPQFRNLRWTKERRSAVSVPSDGPGIGLQTPVVSPSVLLDVFPSSDGLSLDESMVGRTEFDSDYSPSKSLWDERLDESAVFLTEMRHEQNEDNSFQLRIGRGGQIYSLRSQFGESVPPSWRPAGNHVSPWNDEVWQFVAVCTRYNGIRAMEKIGELPPSFTDQLRSSGYQDSFFIHNSGAYIPGNSEIQSLYCPLLASKISEDGRAFSMLNWGLVPQIRTIHRSPLLYYTQLRDAGNGVIEMTWVIHNFSQRDDIVFDHLNAPWGGTRISSLPFRYVSSPEGELLQREGFLNQHGVVDVRKTGGWNISCASDAADSPSLALVYGRDRHLERELERKEAGEVYCQFDHSFYRDWRAQEPSYQTQWKNWETRPANSFRNYDVCEIIPKLRIAPRSTIWFRSFLVVGNRDQVVQKAAGLVDKVDYGLLEFEAEDTPVSVVRPSDWSPSQLSENADAEVAFQVFSKPVEGTRPLFLIENSESGQRIVTTDPYFFVETQSLEISPPSDGPEWDYYRNLRGYAMDRNHSRWLGLIGYAFENQPEEEGEVEPGDGAGAWRRLSEVLGDRRFPPALGHHRDLWVRPVAAP